MLAVYDNLLCGLGAVMLVVFNTGLFRSWRRQMFSAILRFALISLVSAVYRQSLLWLWRCSLSSTMNRLLRSWRRQTVELFEWLAGSACRRPSRLYCMAIIVLPNHIQLRVKIYNCNFLVEPSCDVRCCWAARVAFNRVRASCDASFGASGLHIRNLGLCIGICVCWWYITPNRNQESECPVTHCVSVVAT